MRRRVVQAIRITFLLAVMSAVAVTVATVRTEQSRCIARIQKCRAAQRALHRTYRLQQLQIARLRSPLQVQDRVERFNLQVFAPGDLPAPGENVQFALSE